MRLLFVVQRYGQEVAGGAELLCRELASRLVARGHEVGVVTSRALSYVDWADHYAAGLTEIDGVQVHRLSVRQPRDPSLFGPLDARTVWGRKPVPLHLQQEWMRMQGPNLPDLPAWLAAHAPGHDAVAFFTYLYYPTWAGLPVAAGLVPTVLHPTAHDEPQIALPLFETTFRHPDAFAFSTEEERDLVERRFRIAPPGAVIGIGTDFDVSCDAGRFRGAYGLGDDPYLLFVGRVDPVKGSGELFDFFTTYKERHPGPLRLVVVGEPVVPLPAHPDVVVTGFVDDDVKHDAYEGALALVQPSYFESFSMVLTEAWVHSLPALVQGRCAVLDGQARRSRGAVPYAGFAEFEAAVELLVDQPHVARALGERGRAYVEQQYEWSAVLDRYEDVIARVRLRHYESRSVTSRLD